MKAKLDGLRGILDRLLDGLQIFKQLKNSIFGQVGQVWTGFYHNHANVRVIRGNAKTRPNVSKPVQPTTEAGLC